VQLELGASFLYPGDEVPVKITATSTGAEVKSKGVYIDLRALEQVKVRDDETKKEISKSRITIEQTFQISGPFELAANESKSFEGKFRLPPQVLPSYLGTYATHECNIRGRIEAFGADPDSGYIPVRVGAKS
jgi:hypothetical protein